MNETCLFINRNARPNNNQLITYYLHVRYQLRIQQYPVNNIYFKISYIVKTYTTTAREPSIYESVCNVCKGVFNIARTTRKILQRYTEPFLTFF